MLKGYHICILNLSHDQTHLDHPRELFKKQGLSQRYWDRVPDLRQFKDELRRACQLWIISGMAAGRIPMDHLV